ncbi:MAG: VOC family protein [Rhodocyclaceae bacterium]|nr:VOC family protein [Rhodocyclaceae bacterium]
MNDSVQPIPEGMHSITPYLTVEDAPAAIAFYQKAFGAQEVMRIPGPDGRLLHACLRIGDSALMLAEAFPEWGSRGPLALGGSPVAIHLYVDDVDAAWARAIDAGCQIGMPLENTFWGDRFGTLSDPFGHHWSLAMQVRALSTEEIVAAAAKIDMSGPCGQEG